MYFAIITALCLSTVTAKENCGLCSCDPPYAFCYSKTIEKWQYFSNQTQWIEHLGYIDTLLSHIPPIGEQEFVNLKTFTLQNNELLDCNDLDGFRTSKPDVQIITDLLCWGSTVETHPTVTTATSPAEHETTAMNSVTEHTTSTAVPTRPPQAARASTWIIALMTVVTIAIITLFVVVVTIKCRKTREPLIDGDTLQVVGQSLSNPTFESSV